MEKLRGEGGCDFVSESMKPEHEKVVIDMISRSFADKGDLTTLAGVNYDNLYEQGSCHIIIDCQRFRDIFHSSSIVFFRLVRSIYSFH